MTLRRLPKQVELVEAVTGGRYKVVAHVGGKGSGKTKGGAILALILAGDHYSGLPGMVVAPSANMLSRVTLREFEEICGGVGPGCFLCYKNENKRLYRTSNGSTIFWGSADNPASLEGTTLAWFWIDEAQDVDHEAYKNMVARLRHEHAKPRAVGYVTGTPHASTYLKREFDSGKPTRLLIRASTRDNYLAPEDYVPELESSLSAHEAEAYIDGHWLSPREGRVFPEFDVKTHAIDFSPVPGVPVIGGVDFGFKRPAVVFAQYFADGVTIPGRALPAKSLVIFAEDVVDNISAEGLGRRIAARFPAGGELSLSWLGVDPAGASFSSSSSEHGGIEDVRALRLGLSDGQIAPRLRYVKAAGNSPIRSINTGLEKMRGMVRSASGQVTLFVAKSLADNRQERGIVNAFEGYMYEKGSSKPCTGRKGGGLEHVMDAARYMVRHLSMRGASVESYA